MLVLCINESNIPVMLGTGIFCMGYKPINYDQNHSSISMVISATGFDMVPQCMQGNVYHQLARSYLIFGRVLKPKDVEILQESYMYQLFLDEGVTTILKNIFNLQL